MSSYQKYLSAGLVATGALLAGPSPAWAQDFTVLAGTAVTCTAGSITGDVGIANGTAASPFTNTGCAFAGTAHVNDPAAKSAYAGFLSSYSALAPKTTDVCPVITGTLAGTILTPGTYCVSSEAKTGVLTLDGTSNPNGTWTIKVPSGALTGTNFSVVMAGGAQACNVTWWVDAAATMTTSNLKGNLLTGADITVTGGTFVKGDAFAGGDGSTVTPSGEVTLTGATVVGCEGGSPGPGPGPDPHKCSDRVTGGGYITVNGKHANFGVTGGIRNGKPRGHNGERNGRPQGKGGQGKWSRGGRQGSHPGEAQGQRRDQHARGDQRQDRSQRQDRPQRQDGHQNPRNGDSGISAVAFMQRAPRPERNSGQRSPR